MALNVPVNGPGPVAGPIESGLNGVPAQSNVAPTSSRQPASEKPTLAAAEPLYGLNVKLADVFVGGALVTVSIVV